MKTKILYVVISSDRDIYLEQLWVSLYSLRFFNKNSIVEVITDKETSDRIKSDKYREMNSLINKVNAISFHSDVSNKERSRFLKTGMREYTKGDFLFIDTDTVVTSELSEVDSFSCNIGMVYDWHCHLKDRPNKGGLISVLSKLFDVSLKADTEYYNSGVIYCKDNETSRCFFHKWHENWLSAKDKPKGMQDQQSLIVTLNEMGGVYPISGDFNCQPIVSMRHLTTAKIVHFFNTKWDEYIRSPFYSTDFYRDIKNEGTISDEKKHLILTCRSTFISPTMTICNEDIVIWRSSAFKFLKKIYKRHKIMYKIINKILS